MATQMQRARNMMRRKRNYIVIFCGSGFSLTNPEAG